ncbi:PRA1-like protein [Psilocybe cubensis]|uniref:PRA1 family protein n=2 Tax=Psilocybe cubensis TaxID=181762 RepID=A0A8H7Y2U4_PSICU|nr:PRA1-like protein [Psilocybe cubensis]KAH9485129.1 PRA1-like protein [Psilocybe cubensis]
MEAILKVNDALKSLRETKLSGLRPVSEFFDVQRISKPADLNQATSRISYNTRYFSGNYLLIVALLAVYSVITNYELLLSLIFLVGGFALINKFAPEATQVGEHTITQKHLYTILFVIGIPLFWWAGPFATVFSILIGSAILILGHAALLEPGVESDYAAIQDTV